MSTLPDSLEIIKACRALFLQQLGALLQDSCVLSAPAIQAIQRGAGMYFDEIIVSSRRGSFREEVDGMTISSLTLVEEDDLELDLRLDNLSARLFEQSGADLWKIHLRFVTLLKRQDLAKTVNPVGPGAIARGLDEMFGAAGAGTLDKKLDLLDRIDRRLQQDLPAVYAKINDFLAGEGAEAAPSPIVSRANAPHKGFVPDAVVSGVNNNAPTSATSERTLLALQHALLSRLPAMTQSTLSVDRAAAAAGSPMTQATLERVIFRLDEIDRRGGFAPALPLDASPRLEALIPGLFSTEETASELKPKSLNAAALGVPAAAPEGLAIDTLAMIFEVIFAHSGLSDALKSVVSSLQITLLKVAMQDPDFFSDAAHPARRLIDRMGLAMLGLPVDVPARHPVCQQLLEIAGQLRSRFTGPIGVFEVALTQVDALIAERNVEIRCFAEPYLPMLEQLDRRDQAAMKSQTALDSVIERGLPTPIRDFLDHTWRQVLPLVLAEYGPNSTQWEAYNRVIEELLWTFQPKLAAEDRKALAQRLPEILKVLKAGMERIGMSAEAQAAFLDATFALQTQALRTASAVNAGEVQASNESAPSEVNRLPSAIGNAQAGELRSGAQLLRTLDLAGVYDAPTQPLPCQPGDWLEVRLTESETCVAYLCQFSSGGRRAFLCNPDIGLALAMHSALLKAQFQEGVGRISSSISLFNSAAERALQQTGRS